MALAMGDVERKLEGRVVFTQLDRPQFGFDVFTVDLPHNLNAIKTFELTVDKRLTDGTSINYNAQFVGTADAKLFLSQKKNHVFTTSESELDEIDAGAETVVFVSERSGSARIHLSAAAKTEKDDALRRLSMGPLKGIAGFFFDRPVINKERVFFVSTQEKPAHKPIASWCAVYSTCLRTGDTVRLTPQGVTDFSPSISPSGKGMAVASYGVTKEWEVVFKEDLADLYVFDAEDGSGRKMVAENGGWPSWADENTIYFHRRAPDGFWSIYRLNLLDAQSKSFIPFTAVMNPEIHHYNPFISADSLKLGFHRFRGEEAPDADTVVPFLEPVESPIPTLALQRINGYFPTFSPDASLVAKTAGFMS
ncbi:hypothetical protein KI387_002801 [Taxus chinensis]|uniref:Dipeptidylpeptidase IV N-terminal domain-containing protein n=1 Tax=Taxus chinensis TaxID=29808 RepID=A0AA38LMJ6_TAXCH|nr:hypothetical protein KI387_002801 [Taxus chinensis]